MSVRSLAGVSTKEAMNCAAKSPIQLPITASITRLIKRPVLRLATHAPGIAANTWEISLIKLADQTPREAVKDF
jgi:hypothetical protein